MNKEIENLLISSSDLKNGVPALRADMIGYMKERVGRIYDNSDKVIFTDAAMQIAAALSRMSGFIEVDVADIRIFDETTREIAFGRVEGKARMMRQGACEVIIRHLTDDSKKMNLEGVLDGSALKAQQALQQSQYGMLFFIPFALATDAESIWKALEETLGHEKLKEVAEKNGHSMNPKALLEMPLAKLMQELPLEGMAAAKFLAALSPEPVSPERINQAMKTQNIENMAELFARHAAGNDNIAKALNTVQEKAHPPKNQLQELLQQLPEKMREALTKAIKDGALTGLEFVRIAESGGVQITLKQAMEILKSTDTSRNGVLNAQEVSNALAALPNAKPAPQPQQGAEKGGGGIGR